MVRLLYCYYKVYFTYPSTNFKQIFLCWRFILFHTNYFIILNYNIVDWKMIFFLERIIICLKITFSKNSYHIETSQLWFKLCNKLKTFWIFPKLFSFQVRNVDEQDIFGIPKKLLKKMHWINLRLKKEISTRRWKY